VFLSTGDWRTGDDVADAIGGVPNDIAASFMARNHIDEHGGRSILYPEEYPSVFPFGPQPGA
jgi:hypothetical protein